MDDIRLQPAPPLGGADISIVGNRIRERADIAIVSLAVRRDGESDLAQELKSSFSLNMPQGTRSSVSGEVRLLRSGVDQMLLLKERADSREAADIEAKLAGTCYTTDQTHAMAVLEISGPLTLAALERICPLDLHESRFPENCCGRTLMEHMSATIIRLGAGRYLLLAASSSAASFLHAVETSYRHVAGEGGRDGTQ